MLLLLALVFTWAITSHVRAQSRSDIPQDGMDILAGSRGVGVTTSARAFEPAVYYAVNHAIAFATPDSSQAYIDLDARESVEVVSRSGAWVEVKTSDGAQGFVRQETLSNVWIRVSKKSKTVHVYRGADVVAAVPADMAYNFFLDKEQRGSNTQPDHWRTPEGLYFVVGKNAGSRFYKAFVLNYPSLKDGRAGLDDGLITQSQFDAIAAADQQFEMPPMDTPLGGWIEIHGMGTGSRTMWTRGCVAIPNESIDDLWDLVHIGTPVLIES